MRIADVVTRTVARLSPMQQRVVLSLPADGTAAEVEGFRPQISAMVMEALPVMPDVAVRVVWRRAHGPLHENRFGLSNLGRRVHAALRARGREEEH